MSGLFGICFDDCRLDFFHVIALGRLFITHRGNLRILSFKSLQFMGANGDIYGVPKVLREHIWANIQNIPTITPKSPKALLIKIRINLKIITAS